jgi:uncharacterized protein YaaQ
MATSCPDRLAILTLSGSQSAALMREMTRRGFQFTVVDSTSGLLREALVCLLIGFEQERLSALLEIVRANCGSYRGYVAAEGFPAGGPAGLSMVEAQMGGAQFEQF